MKVRIEINEINQSKQQDMFIQTNLGSLKKLIQFINLEQEQLREKFGISNLEIKEEIILQI